MKYQISEHVIIEETPDAIIKDIIYHELDEQEFLVEYLKNPRLTYWVTDDDNIKRHYKNGILMASIENGVVTNHSMKTYP
jgi:hypothetical protein